MATKKEVKKPIKRQTKSPLSIEEQINKNPLYMKVCQSSASCESEKKLTDLGDMTANICTQCLHIFGWELKTVEKPVKEKPVKKAAVKPEIEEAVVVSETKDDAVERAAEELRKTFEAVDSMGIGEVPKPVAPKVEKKQEVAVKEFEDDDFDMEFAEPKVSEDAFAIMDISIVSTTEVALICETHSQKARFKVITTTSEEKVKMIQASPEKVIGKKAKISFKGLDEKGRPKEAEYISFAK
jgi:hypothetical protein